MFCAAAVPLWLYRGWRMTKPLLFGAVGWMVLVPAWLAAAFCQGSPWLFVAVLLVVWIADTAAYFSGRAFGRHKLAPRISPGKTWEGLYGAWIAVALYALALVPYAGAAGFRLPVTTLAIASWVVFLLLLASISVVGD